MISTFLGTWGVFLPRLFHIQIRMLQYHRWTATFLTHHFRLTGSHSQTINVYKNNKQKPPARSMALYIVSKVFPRVYANTGAQLRRSGVGLIEFSQPGDNS
ncbi:uncharacterized protein LOC117120873 [Anneissia japonica]|uniref:uncharacterized protein LOC117120873 n=1 Tax=Anneissia japonica TaxID=1529436 RepID=UPI0014258092|nr:uncharacterized protein LOC117120873 [Anneissia japonica]